MLFHIGRGDRARVYSAIKTNVTYFLAVMISFSVLLFVFSHWLARLFFFDAELRGLFANMLKILSLFSWYNSTMPGLSTLLRVFDMNLHASLIVFLVFGIPFIVQNYVYVKYLNLENYSPVLALSVCNISIVSLSIYFLWKNTEASLSKQIQAFTESSSKRELLLKSSETKTSGNCEA